MKYVVAVAGLTFGLGAQAAMVSKTNSTTGYIDNNSGGMGMGFEDRIVSFNAMDFMGDPTLVTGITIEVAFDKSGDVLSFVPEGTSSTDTPPFYEEMQFQMRAPDGTTVILIASDEAAAGASFNSGTNTFQGTLVFDQMAAMVVNNNTQVLVPGTYRPDPFAAPNGLDDFLGLDAVGDWTLQIQDTAPGDGVSFYRVVVNLVTDQSSGGGSAPVPGTLALFGCAALAGARLRRRRAVARRV